MKFIKTGLILSALALFIFACAENKLTTANSNNTVAAVPTAAQPTASIDELAAAKKTYIDSCAKCHKEDGAGGKVVIDGETIKAASLISEHSKKDDDAEIAEHIKEGIPDEGMPAFKNRLNDDQIKDLVKYIRRDLQGK